MAAINQNEGSEVGKNCLHCHSSGREAAAATKRFKNLIKVKNFKMTAEKFVLSCQRACVCVCKV